MSKKPHTPCAIGRGSDTITPCPFAAAYKFNDGRDVCHRHYTMAPGALKLKDADKAPARVEARMQYSAKGAKIKRRITNDKKRADSRAMEGSNK